MFRKRLAACTGFCHGETERPEGLCCEARRAESGGRVLGRAASHSLPAKGLRKHSASRSRADHQPSNGFPMSGGARNFHLGAVVKGSGG